MGHRLWYGEVNGCRYDNSSSNLSWWYRSVAQHVVVVDYLFYFIFFIFSHWFICLTWNKKKSEIYVLESVLLDNIPQCVCHAIFLFIIVILSLLINDKFYQNFFNDGVDMLTSKFRHRSIMQPLFKVISTSYITNFKNRFCLLS
jgi:hypothetical protein